jgi:hypothetical protein
MPTAANPQSYQTPAWGSPPWGSPGNNAAGSAPPYWHPWGIGRPIAIAAVVFLLAAGHIGRMLFWPLALAGLVFMVATGRIGCRRRWGRGNWGQQGGMQGQGPGNPNGGPNQGGGWQPSMPPWARWCGGDRAPAAPPTSGNHAFDEYRAETLRRLEEEQNEFSGFLERLRFAKDKAEFDQFMAERRQAPRPPVVPDEPAHG